MAAGDTLPGTRLDDGEHQYHDTPAGAYWRDQFGDWRCKTPNAMAGTLVVHDVVEHDDGTITVSPSILVEWPHKTTPMTWHGYLERGIWREV